MNKPEKAFGVYERPEAGGRSRWLWVIALALAALGALAFFLSR